MSRRLSQISGTRGSGTKRAGVPFAGATLRVATTPLSLATEGVALLPVTVLETRPMAAYEIQVAGPLTPPAGADRRAAVVAMAHDYAGRLLPLARAWPGQWTGWGRLQLPDRTP